MLIALVDTQWTGHHPLYYKSFLEVLRMQGHDTLAMFPNGIDPCHMSQVNGFKNKSLDYLAWNPPRLNFSPRRLTVPLEQKLQVPWLIRQLKSWESKRGRKIDLVFFACLYNRFLKQFSSRFRWPWVGLYLHLEWNAAELAKSNPVLDDAIISYFGSHFFRGAGVLDETALSQFSSMVNCANIVAFPDFAAEAPPKVSAISSELNNFARGRKIVGLAGHLIPSKGVRLLAEAALLLRDHPIAFAFVGEYNPASFSDGDNQIISRAFRGDNVFTYLKRINCDEVWNGVFNSFDINFAAYVNFPHSSGTLTKTAFFRKPIIVSDGYLMASRVRDYGLGIVLSEFSGLAVANAISELLHSSEITISEANVARYLQSHSVDRLGPAIDILVRQAF
jgi:glycosyltransferase involved in cell wall biosynthesis